MMDSTIVNWKLEDEVVNDCNISYDKATKVIKLLNEGSTVPFIARYRKEYTGDLPPTTLNKIKDKVEECKNVIERVEKSLKTIEKSGLLSDNVKIALRSCRTVEDVEFVTEPFKVKGPKTLANRARQAGLEHLALKVLFESTPFSLESVVPKNALDEFTTMDNVEEAIKNIIADIFAKNTSLPDDANKLNCPNMTTLQSQLAKKYVNIDQTAKIDNQIRIDIGKLKNYHNFQRTLNKLLPHQMMAINRGEKSKILKVTIQIPDSVQKVFIELCKKRYLSSMCDQFKPFVVECAIDAYKRLVEPHLIRKIRKNLKKNAKSQSLEVFESNLRQLVMTSPLRGASILGLDPGHYNGCKLAVIDRNSQLIDTAVIYLSRSAKEAQSTFVQLMLKHKIEYVAIGDGCGNDKASIFVSTMINEGRFPSLNVKFAIVRECGASVWSVTPEAENEFPNLDPNLRSAVSIARRLQDPLAEYVKMDPKSLGVGMYQHDLLEKSLISKVNTVLDECISFTGVDINHAPQHVIEHVSGLGPSKAKAIVEYREKNGYFRNRRQLLKVRGIGEAIFVQCAGFIRIKNIPNDNASIAKNFSYEPDGDAMMDDMSNEPRAQSCVSRVRGGDNDVNPLDQTSIHPESYDVAERIIQLLNLELIDVGTTIMQQATKTFMANVNYLDILSSFKTECCGMETLQDIVTSLSRPLEFDERNNFSSSMLRQSYGSSFDLQLQQRVMGFVMNVTTFGIFIDIGVERSAFCHRLIDGIMLGDTVEGIVTFIDHNKLSLDHLRKIPRF